MDFTCAVFGDVFMSKVCVLASGNTELVFHPSICNFLPTQTLKYN